MLKNPYEVLIEATKTKLERDRKTNEFIFTQSDSLITWLVGFAFAALSLIVSNVNSIKTYLHSNAKPIIIGLTLTIVIGLAFRYVSYLVMIFEKKLDTYFDNIFSEFEMTPIQPDSDIDTCDFEEIKKRLKDDFGFEYSALSNLNEIQKQKEIPNLIIHYKKLCEHAKKQLDIGINYIAEINESAYKIPKQTSIDLFNRELTNPKIGYDVKKWDQVRSWLFGLCILSFLVSVLITSIYLIKTV